MICPNCGSEMPPEFRYCGRCGGELTSPEPVPLVAPPQIAEERADEPQPSLPTAPEASQWDEGPAAERRTERAAISGPSFLGLSGGEAEPEESYNYLLQDEPRPRHAGAFVLAIVLVALAGVVAVKWSSIHQYLVKENAPPANAYPQTANHADSGMTTPPKTPSQTAAPGGQASQPQMIVEEHPAAAPPPKTEDAAQPGAAVPQRQAQSQPQTQPGAAVPQERAAGLLTLGENYLYGRGVPRNCPQAVVYLRAAAIEGNASARTHLGAMYSTGECVARDRVLAYHWFTLAKKAAPRDPWLESNLNMLWREMSNAERQRVGTER